MSYTNYSDNQITGLLSATDFDRFLGLLKTLSNTINPSSEISNSNEFKRGVLMASNRMLLNPISVVSGILTLENKLSITKYTEGMKFSFQTDIEETITGIGIDGLPVLSLSLTTTPGAIYSVVYSNGVLNWSANTIIESMVLPIDPDINIQNQRVLNFKNSPPASPEYNSRFTELNNLIDVVSNIFTTNKTAILNSTLRKDLSDKYEYGMMIQTKIMELEKYLEDMVTEVYIKGTIFDKELHILKTFTEFTTIILNNGGLENNSGLENTIVTELLTAINQYLTFLGIDSLEMGEIFNWIDANKDNHINDLKSAVINNFSRIGEYSILIQQYNAYVHETLSSSENTQANNLTPVPNTVGPEAESLLKKISEFNFPMIEPSMANRLFTDIHGKIYAGVGTVASVGPSVSTHHFATLPPYDKAINEIDGFTWINLAASTTTSVIFVNIGNVRLVIGDYTNATRTRIDSTALLSKVNDVYNSLPGLKDLIHNENYATEAVKASVTKEVSLFKNDFPVNLPRIFGETIIKIMNNECFWRDATNNVVSMGPDRINIIPRYTKRYGYDGSSLGGLNRLTGSENTATIAIHDEQAGLVTDITSSYVPTHGQYIVDKPMIIGTIAGEFCKYFYGSGGIYDTLNGRLVDSNNYAMFGIEDLVTIINGVVLTFHKTTNYMIYDGVGQMSIMIDSVFILNGDIYYLLHSGNGDIYRFDPTVTDRSLDVVVSNGHPNYYYVMVEDHQKQYPTAVIRYDLDGNAKFIYNLKGLDYEY